jgi:regulator of protease activity HflC (stomatin/prohibitin superfamily)
MKGLLFLFVMLMMLAVIAARTFIIVKDGEGIAVFRLGQLSQVSRPGLVIIVPFIDKIVRVSLEGIPKWETMPEEKLKERILELVEARQKQ